MFEKTFINHRAINHVTRIDFIRMSKWCFMVQKKSMISIRISRICIKGAPMDKNFVFSKLSKVRGYIDPLDALLFTTIIEGQAARGYHGALAEIGVYYGRSFFLMKHLAQPGEKALAIDLFDIGEIRNGRHTQYTEFLEFGRMIDCPVDEALVIAGDSTKMPVSDITDKVGPVRFFSVDGGHQLEHLQSDSALARDSLNEDGVIAFDDSFNPEWPEVTAGLIDFLRQHDATHAAFCVSNKKTYVCRRDKLEEYKLLIRQSPYLDAFDIRDLEFLGTRGLRVHHPIKRRIVYELMVRGGLGEYTGAVYKL